MREKWKGPRVVVEAGIGIDWHMNSKNNKKGKKEEGKRKERKIIVKKLTEESSHKLTIYYEIKERKMGKTEFDTHLLLTNSLFCRHLLSYCDMIESESILTVIMCKARKNSRIDFSHCRRSQGNTEFIRKASEEWSLKEQIRAYLEGIFDCTNIGDVNWSLVLELITQSPT